MEKTLTDVQVDWRERKFERNRADILEAAARAFAKKGLAGATMQDIAAEAGYTVPTLYSYFKSKEEISHGLVAMVQRELLSALELEPIGGLTFAQNLELFIRRAFETADKRRSTLSLLLQLGPAAKVPHDDGHCSGPQVVRRAAIEWARKASAGEGPGGRPAELVAQTVLGIWHSFFLNWIFEGADGRLADQASAATELILYGLCGKPKQP